MPEVVRGSRIDEAHAHQANNSAVTTPSEERTARIDEHEAPQQEGNQTASRQTTQEHGPDNSHLKPQNSETLSHSVSPSRHVAFRADSNEPPAHPVPLSRDRRRSSSFFRANSETRPDAEVYYDSRAATKREWKRRATTLQDYYHDNPELLPQLPFTWHRGWKRWRLIGLIVVMWIDACVLPIVLYYGLAYGGDVQGWIIFAVVTTIWGGPTYLEFALRTLKLMKKERFYRPLGTNHRWCFDYMTWVSVATITAVTALFVVGSAPHIVWLRVLCMPMPALLYCLGIFTLFPTLYYIMGWKAPFRISSTGKGEPVKPAVYYFIEDTVAVNANAGRPYREALAARYDASPRFRRMIYIQSLFWSIPPIILAIPLTVVAVVHSVPTIVGYAVCEFFPFPSTYLAYANSFKGWAVPFIWATLWGLISLWWCKRDMVRERVEWEATKGPIKVKEGGLDTDEASTAPPSEEKEKEELKKETRPEQAV